MHSTEELEQVTFFDATGQQVYEYDNPSGATEQLHVSGLLPGVHLLSTTDRLGKIDIEKIVKW